jgi:hypothetical protein
MGRLEVRITHGRQGGGPAQWGAVVALIVLVLFAAAGHCEIGAMLHEVLTVVEITAFSLVGLAVLAAVVVIVVRVRGARRDRARRGHVEVMPVPPNNYYRVRVEPADGTRPALDTPRRRPAGWPLPSEWGEVAPRDGDDRRHYS